MVGCGIGVLLRMVWVLAVLLVCGARCTPKCEEAIFALSLLTRPDDIIIIVSCEEEEHVRSLLVAHLHPRPKRERVGVLLIADPHPRIKCERVRVFSPLTPSLAVDTLAPNASA
jgi:hypothetical protein